MQKLMLTLSLTVFVVFFSIAANLTNENNNSINESQQTNTNQMAGNGDCTVTASWTAQGEDCFGNPITVTGSCTSTALTCAQAYSQAGGCAYSIATLGVLQINDCP